MIVMTATLASIGTAGVPGAGIIMLIIVLESIGVPSAGIALILAPDRILDMFRTIVNVTGDAMVCTVVASTEGITGWIDKKIQSTDQFIKQNLGNCAASEPRCAHFRSKTTKEKNRNNK